MHRALVLGVGSVGSYALVGLPGDAAADAVAEPVTDLTEPTVDDRVVEKDVFALVNQRREAHGLDAYPRSETAAEFDDRHAERMARTGEYGHRAPDDVPQEERYAASAGGEVITKLWVDRRVDVSG